MKVSPPKGVLLKRLTKIFSWVTGISLGSSFILALLGLIATAIFVRTEFFQTALRNRIVEIVREELQAEISFTSAKVEIFSFVPSIHFEGIHFEQPAENIKLDLKRFSLGISVWSLPLLTFNQLVLAKAEIEGLDYRITSVKAVKKWIDSFRPKDSVVPFRFQTSVRNISLVNVGFEVQLSQDDILKTPAKGRLLIETFQIGLRSDQTELSGMVSFSDGQVGRFGPYGGKLILDRAVIEGRKLRFRNLNLNAGDDYLAFSGTIHDLQNPILDVVGETKLQLGAYLSEFSASGELSSDFKLKGPWKDVQGSGTLAVQQFQWRKKYFDSLKSAWKIDQNSLELLSLQWASGAESGSGKARIPFSASRPAVLDLTFQDSDLASYLNLLTDDLRNWRGKASGEIHFEGTVARQISGTMNLVTEVSGMDIRSWSKNVSIMAIPFIRISGSGQISNLMNGELNFNVNINENLWNGKMKWDPERLDLTWGSQLNGRQIGELFGYRIALTGQMPGSYAGPWGKLQLLARPDLKVAQLNGERVHNLRGNFRFLNRRLLADPFVADELNLSGGIYFHPTGADQFEDFQFRVKDLDLREFFGYLHIGSDAILNASGHIAGEGCLSGPLRRPQGSGTLSVHDWTIGNQKQKGYRANAQWAWSKDAFYLTDIVMLLSQREEGLRGEMTIDGRGLADVSLGSERLRLSTWSYLLGISTNIQSLGKVSFNFQRDIPSLTFKVKAFETSFGGSPQLDSTLEFSWVKNEIRGDLNLFQGAMVAQLMSTRQALQQSTVVDFSIQNLNMTPWVSFLANSRLETMVNGKGSLSSEGRRPEGETVFAGLLEQWKSLRGDVNVQSVAIKRTNVVLQQMRPFKVTVSPGKGAWLRFESDQIQIQSSEGRRMVLKGFYEGMDSFAIDVAGKTDLRAISGLSPTLSRSEGVLEVEGNFKPEGFTGRINLSKGMVSFQDSPLVVRNVEAIVRSEKSDFEILNLSGSLREGDLMARGRVKLTTQGVESARILLELSNTLFQPQDGVSLRASGPLELKVVRSQGEISGRLQIFEGLFRKRIDLRSDIVRVFRSRKINLKSSETTALPWDSWTLKINVDSTEPFNVRNNLAEGGANLRLLISGTIKEPRIVGNVDIVRGQFSFNNRQFVVRSGSVVFQNPNTNIPNYDIRAETEIGDYRIFVKLFGGPDEQKISYSSEPALSEKDILSVISFGLPSSAEELKSQDPTRTVSFTGISFVTGQIQDQIESRLSRDLGVQRFSLGPAFFEETGRTELQMTVGTDLIRNRLGVNYSQFISASGGHKVELDFKVNRNFSLISSWRDVREEGKSTDDFGGDLRFRFEIE